jgi:hypothetical protein
MKVACVFRLEDRRGEAMETRKSGFLIIIAETRGHMLSPEFGWTKRWGVSKMGSKDKCN